MGSWTHDVQTVNSSYSSTDSSQQCSLASCSPSKQDNLKYNNNKKLYSYRNFETRVYKVLWQPSESGKLTVFHSKLKPNTRKSNLRRDGRTVCDVKTQKVNMSQVNVIKQAKITEKEQRAKKNKWIKSQINKKNKTEMSRRIKTIKDD